MKEHLFVYGTLAPDHAPADLRDVIASLRPISAGSMPGRIFDLGSYPGAVFDSSARTRVFGQVFELPEDESFLERIDEYEEYVPERAEKSLFVRQKQPVTLSDGNELHCWVYLYNRDPGKAPPVPGGNYLAWTSPHQHSTS